MKPDTHEGLIYAVGVEGIAGVKIGCTTSPLEKRLSQFQCGHPTLVAILAQVPVKRDLYEIEMTLHAILRKERIRGEWFALEIDQNQLEELVVRAIEWLEIAAARVKWRAPVTKLPERKKIPAPLEKIAVFEIDEAQRKISFHEKLRMLRREKNFTQQELQQLSGVPYTTISRIETGRTDVVTSSTLQRLAHALDVTLDYLIGDSDLRRTGVEKRYHKFL